jgi:hypothetical protein
MRHERIIRQFKRDGDSLVFQFTREHLNSLQIEYSREAMLTLDLTTGVIRADDIVIQAEATRLAAEYSAKRLTSDLTRLIQRVFDRERAALVPIREQGGCYFVPETHAALVDQARTLLTEIGGDLRSFAVQLGDGQTNQSVAEAMTEYLIQRITEFRESCESLSADSPADVMTRQQERIGELRRHLDMYRGLLMGYASEIDTAIQQAEKDMLAKLIAPAQTSEVPCAN